VRTSALVLLAMAALGCGSEADVSWGPLAVMVTDSGMQARNEGMLVMTDHCVFLERGGDRQFLVWPANDTSWLPATKEIAFRRMNGEVISVRDGQLVVLGGGELSRTVDGPNGEKLPRRIDWVVAPDPACVVDVRWLVSDVQPQ
jgi:hypothetical protein